jgi:hypothetical protein
VLFFRPNVTCTFPVFPLPVSASFMGHVNGCIRDKSARTLVRERYDGWNFYITYSLRVPTTVFILPTHT